MNRRLQNGEQGKHLVEWLNSLPSVKKVLDREFGGEPVLKQNLSQWKQGGYPDWVAQRGAVAEVRRMMEESGELGTATLGEFGDRMATWLMARCVLAAGKLLRGEMEESTVEKSLRELCRNVVALRRGDHYARWIAIEQERMEAQKPDPKKLEKQFREWARDPKIQEEFFGKPRMTKEERDRAFLQVLGRWPEEKEPGAASATVEEAEEDESESEGSDPNSGAVQ